MKNKIGLMGTMRMLHNEYKAGWQAGIPVEETDMPQIVADMDDGILATVCSKLGIEKTRNVEDIWDAICDHYHG